MGFKVKKDFAVVGVGNFGTSLIDTFLKYNVNVMAFDKSEERIQKIANKVAYASVLDTTDEEALAGSGIKNVDEVIVCMGDNVEACIMTVVSLKNIGISNITVKSDTEKLTSVLVNLGVKDIVSPEREYGEMLAKRKMHRLVTDFVSMDDKHSMVQIKIEKDSLHNTPLFELDFRNKFNLNIVAIKRGEELLMPKANSVINKDDVVYLIGEDYSIYEFEKFLENK